MPGIVAPADALEDIRRAARKARDEQRKMEELKVRANARDRADAARHRADRARKQREFAGDDRATFRDELRRLIRPPFDRSALEIVDLCARHGREIAPPVQEALINFRLSKAFRMARAARIDGYRELGVPEAVILDELAAEESLKIGLRDGPRNRAEALVRAAKTLLKYPPAGPPPRG